MAYLRCTDLFFMLISIGGSLAFSANITTSENNVVGGTARVTCSWTDDYGETVGALTIRPVLVRPNPIMSHYVRLSLSRPFPVYSFGGLFNSKRHSLNLTALSIRRVYFDISGLQCSDDQTYVCSFDYSSARSLPVYNREYTSGLYVTGRPKTPTIRVTSHTGTDIPENSNMTVTCRSNSGSIRFVVSRDGTSDIVPDADSRIVGKRNVSREPGENQCDNPTELTFAMKVTRADQNLAITCFVTSSDNPLDAAASRCDNPVSQLCNQTATQRIIYGVSNDSVSVSREPSGQVYQGTQVTLTCRASGLPAPSYTWAKEGEGTTYLNGSLESDGSSRLVLSSLAANTSPLKYSCRVQNTVLQKVYTASAQISFIVASPSTASPSTASPSTATPSSASPPSSSPSEGKILIFGDPLRGQNVTIRCTWAISPGDDLWDLTIRPSPDRPATSNFYYFRVTPTGWSSTGSLYDSSRHSLDILSIVNQSIDLRISNLQCADSQNYSCHFRFVSSGPVVSRESIAGLQVKVAPQSPTVRVSSHSGNDIQENQNITVVCAVNLGSPGRGGLQWRIYRGGEGETLGPEDPRIIKKTTVSLLPGDEPCTRRIEDTFQMQVSRQDQGLVVVCFVQSLDFPVLPEPSRCNNVSTDRCGQTSPQRIIYQDTTKLRLSVNGQEENITTSQFCSFNLTAGQPSLIQLCCLDPVNSCYPSVSFNGAVIATLPSQQGNSTCVLYTLTPVDSDFRLELTLMYSWCSQKNFEVAGRCTLLAA